MAMKGPSLCHFLCFFFVFSLLWFDGISADGGKKRVYIVYMGSSRQHSLPEKASTHVELLASVIGSEEQIGSSLVRSYRTGFSGFTAYLSKEEAATMAQKPGVISVFLDPILHLHTTRSWDFLQYKTEQETNSNSDSSSDSTNGVDTIIGVLDSGIWPESESFNDRGMGAIPARWKGKCMGAHDFNDSNCNRKLIGARYYEDSSYRHSTQPLDQTPRDAIGHGTHTASTAAGSPVSGAGYYGLATGTAKGGSPSSRIAVYRVCTPNGCTGSTVLAAFEDAIADGVDILSISLGASPYYRPDFSSDPIAIGSFHAVEHGILVVCSAGNEGPHSGTVVNDAPWILTVAATTIDRDLESDVVLGGSDNKVIKGEAINFSNLSKSPVYPLIYAGAAASNSSSEDDASNCYPNALDGDKIKGKIVLCQHSDTSFPKTKKMKTVKDLGGIGLALIDDLERFVASNFGTFPMTLIDSSSATQIFFYINSTKNPVATILPTITVNKYKPAPAVAYFSSRGPSILTRNILKPDIAAPGVNILAAWKETNSSSSEVPPGQKCSHFNVISGTSMACPHITGISALIKSKNPTWSPSAIRSAIITTAIETNNVKAPLSTDSGSVATSYDSGAGEVSPSGSLQPGLVYETETEDYLLFLCNYGYPESKIKLISSNTTGFVCPKKTGKDSISDLNYPSISVSEFNGKERRKVKRTVTNVGDNEAVYTSTINSPRGLDVKIVPKKLRFSLNNRKLSYQVIFSATSSSVKGDLFGSITWSDGKHRVRTPFVVSSS